MNKKKIHVVHHTHWDMEWYFTKYDTAALFNYDIHYLLDKLENASLTESFLFDGQVAPFEETLRDPVLKKRIQKLVRKNKLKIGPWYSQPDMRLTSDIGLLRNYEYGKEISGIKTNNFNYTYTPDSFGFSENIPILLKHIGKKYSILWRGVNRKVINNSPVFDWIASNGEKIRVYNIASGYFVGRYLYDNKTFEGLYKNNILPSIKYQSDNNKYSNILLPSGGDQQPYNNDLHQAIKRLNKIDKNNKYILSSFNDFIKDFNNEVKSPPRYKGNLTYAYGGRLHKTVGSHRPDIKQGIYKNELFASQILEPLLLSTNLGDKNYPFADLNKMWRNILLSQAHDAYASCNSDQVNKQIKDRLDVSNNILEAHKDMIIKFISQNYTDNSLLIFNPTIFSGKQLFKTVISTSSKTFTIVDKNNNVIPYLTYKQEKIAGGKKVVYTAQGEVEKQKPAFYNSNIFLLQDVNKQSITQLKVIENSKLVSEFKTSFNVNYNRNKFSLLKNNLKQELDFKFMLDAGDSYNLDLYDEVNAFNLSDAKLVKSTSKTNNGIIVKTYHFLIELPDSIETWIKSRRKCKVNFKIEFIMSSDIRLNITFDDVPNNLLVQTSFKINGKYHNHQVMSHFGFIKRENKFNLAIESNKLREPVSDFNIMHGNISYGTKLDNLSITTLDSREYIIEDNKFLNINLFRTPDVLGRANLRSRPGRASGLPDLVVPTPHSAKAIKDLEFTLRVNFNQTTKKINNKLNGIMLENMARHNQKLFKYNGRTNSWTLPDIKFNKQLIKNIKVSNSSLRIISFYKTSTHYVAIVNNPHFEEIKTNISIMKKTYKNVIFKSNQIKEWRVKINK